MNLRTKTVGSQRWASCILATLLLACTSLTAAARDHKYTSVGEYKYYSNMTITTKVMLGDEVLLDCEVASFVGDECRSSWLSHPEQGGLVFQLIHGQTTGEILTFRVIYTDENGQEQDVLAEQTYVYKNDAVVGDAQNPYIIELPGKPKVLSTYPDGKEKAFSLSQATGEKQDSVAMATTIYIRGVWTADDYAALDNALDSSEKLNPCQLRYLPAESELPTGWTNTISGTKALTDITLSDGTQTAPASLFVAEDIDLDGHTATYTRTFALANGKSGWNTVIVPFAFEVLADDEVVNIYKTMEAQDSKGYWALRLDYGDDEDGLMFTQLTGKGKNMKLEAYIPYLLAFPGDNFDTATRNISLAGKTITLRSTETTLAATPSYLSNLTVDDTDYALMGTFSVIRKQPMYLLRPAVTDSGKDAFCFYDQGNLMPFRAYVKDLTGANATRMLGMNINFEEKNTSEIKEIDQSPLTSHYSKGVYDLQGRRLNSVAGNQLLIINGKKVLVK